MLKNGNKEGVISITDNYEDKLYVLGFTFVLAFLNVGSLEDSAKVNEFKHFYLAVDSSNRTSFLMAIDYFINNNDYTEENVPEWLKEIKAYVEEDV